MLSGSMYTREYIQGLQEETGMDPVLLEKVIYAFALLEAITLTGLPFCFKGGTSLMLLLDEPKRLSTDIDIIVDPEVDIYGYIHKARDDSRFIDADENTRKKTSDIEKRHFRFRYNSHVNNRESYITLDVVFETTQYIETVPKPIKNRFLQTEGEDIYVNIPDVNSILGDKLTAFAPHTTGIHLGNDKELEIIKQMFDCSVLFDAMTDYANVKNTYDRIVRTEMGYRGLSVSPAEVLMDTIQGCLCIASKGNISEKDYRYFKKGIDGIRHHIFDGRFNGEIAGVHASKVMYVAAAILTGQSGLNKIGNASEYLNKLPEITKPRRFSYLKMVDEFAYGYFVEAVNFLNNTGLLPKIYP